MKLLRVAYPFWPLWFICAITQLSGRIFTVIALLLEEISHSQVLIPLCPSPCLKSHFCVFKGELFFCFPFIPAERWPLFCFNGIRAFLLQLLPPGCQPTLSSKLTLNEVYFSLSYLFHSLPFLQAGPLLISLSLSPFFFQFSLFCSSGFGSKGNKASLKWFTYSLFRFPYSSLPLPGRSGKFWPWVIVQTGTFVVATEMILQLIKWSRNDREKRRNLTVPSQLKLRE